MELKNAVIYARYSSHNQKEESIEGQVRVCKEYAERHGYLISEEYVDRAISGTTDSRPAFQRMIQDSKKGLFDMVLVYKFDRFARDRYDSATYKKVLKENNVILVSAMENIPNTPEGIILEGLLESMAEYYSAELSQKITRGKMQKALKLQHHGGAVPIGYKLDDNERYIIDEDTAPIVKDIFSRYTDQQRIVDIVADINFLQLRKNSDTGISIDTVRNVLRNPHYIGTYTMKDFVQENAFEPIVDKDTWDRVQEIMKKNKRNPAKHKAKEPYLLSGKVVCAYCEKNVVGSCGGNPSRRYYRCGGQKQKNGCKKKGIRKEELEQIVFSLIMDTFSDKERQNEIARKCTEHTIERNKETDLLKSLKKQLVETGKQKSNIIKALATGTTSTTLIRTLEELEQAEIKLSDEVRRNSLTYPTVKEKDIITLLEGLINNGGDKIVTEKILLHLVTYVKLFDDKIILCFDLLGNEDKNMEVVHFFDGENTKDLTGTTPD